MYVTVWKLFCTFTRVHVRAHVYCPFCYRPCIMYSPFIPLCTVCSSFTIHILLSTSLFPFLMSFLQLEGTLSLVHNLTLYISTDKTEVISVLNFLTAQLYILMNKCIKQFCQNITDMLWLWYIKITVIHFYQPVQCGHPLDFIHTI